LFWREEQKRIARKKQTENRNQNYQIDTVSYQLADVGRGGGSVELPDVKPSKYLSTPSSTHECSHFALKTLWLVGVE
jgi:hypothetical protein